jgi:hypothetical protein
MKRREFLAGTAGVAGCLLPPWAGAAAPCPPPAVSVNGGNAATSNCGATGSPAWFAAMAANTWAQPSSNTLDAVQFKPLVNGSTYTPAYTGLNAYCGGLVDNDRSEFLMVANGGHNDYLGNEGYALALWADTPYWYRLNDPTPFAGNIWSPPDQGGVINMVNGTARYLDGRCPAMHTYGLPVHKGGKVWFPAQGHVVGGGSWVNGICSYDRLQTGMPRSDGSGPVAWGSGAGPWAYYGGYNNTPHTVDSAQSGSWNCGYSIVDNNGYIWLTNPQSADFQYVRVNTADGTHNCYVQRVLGGGAPPYGVRWYNTYISDRALTAVSAVNGVMTWFHKGSAATLYLMSVDKMGKSISSANWRAVTCGGNVPPLNGSDYTGTGYAVYFNGAIYYMDWSLAGSAIYKLTVPADLENGTWTWSILPNTGGSSGPQNYPGAAAARQHYGRFNIVRMPSGAGCVVNVFGDMAARTNSIKPYVYKL